MSSKNIQRTEPGAQEERAQKEELNKITEQKIVVEELSNLKKNRVCMSSCYINN
uniref:Uncharacterized protein n=1 Tax=Sinocyclocheilus anshuiensis TaxID=1608454 RepID=A0A671L7Q7_9TELE